MKARAFIIGRPTTFGGYSNDALPPATLRWMDDSTAQYDAIANRNGAPTPPGNYPQAWYNQYNSVITGGKYVAATQKWPSVNFGRPCGPDKFAVDQTTVCCITGGAAPNFTVQVAGTSLAPLAPGGLAVNDYIVSEGDGIYRITGISGSGPWTVSVGGKLDDLPTGFEFSTGGSGDGYRHLGRLRFPNTPGICGRAMIATNYGCPAR